MLGMLMFSGIFVPLLNGSVVNFDDFQRFSLVVIPEGEDASVAVVVWGKCPRCVTNRYVLQLIVPFEVKSAPCWSEQGYCQVVSVSLLAPIVLGPQDAIKTPLDMNKSKRTD
jgi:hypothetical protein